MAVSINKTKESLKVALKFPNQVLRYCNSSMSSCQEQDCSAESTQKQKGEYHRSCSQKIRDCFSLVPQNATPPNWGFLWLIFISLFSSAFTLTFLFPFLPEMVKTFGYSEEEKGTYVGLVASSVFAGRAVGSFFWGWLSDLKGRRLVLLITILFNGVFSFLFGFVHSLHWAMAVRFLAGLANGTVGVAKTVLYEVSDNTNQAFHMSVISIAWGSGLILGPTLGGYLALPATKYPSVFSADGFFGDYPFVLPSVCCLIVCGIVFIIVFFKFHEPEVVLNTELYVDAREEAKKDKSVVEGEKQVVSSTRDILPSQPLHGTIQTSQSPTSSPSHLKVGMSLETLHCESDMVYYYAQRQSEKNSNDHMLEEMTMTRSMHNLSPGLKTSPDDDQELVPMLRTRSYSHGDQSKHRKVLELTEEGSAAGPGKKSPEVSALEAGTKAGLGNTLVNPDICLVQDKNVEKRSKISSCWSSIRHSSFVQILSIGGVRHSVALYTTMSFAIIGYEDVFTIFASTSEDYDGLAFSTDEIGIALGAVSIPLMFIQIKIYPMLVAKFGIRKAYLINIFFIFIPVQMMPLLHLLVSQKVWLWVCLLLLSLPMRVAANSCFAGSSLLINNSVPTGMAGKVNGIGMTATAVARTLAPTIGGAMFAWTVKMSQIYGPPLDVNLTFVFFGFVLFISALQCIFLPDHLNHQKK